MALRAPQDDPKIERFDYEAALRYSLEEAENNDKQLATWARSPDADAMASTNPQFQPDVANWDHSNAEFWLWVTNVDADSFKYTKGRFITAATIIGAELQVSRNFSYTTTEPRILKLVTMANTQVPGYRGGRLL